MSAVVAALQAVPHPSSHSFYSLAIALRLRCKRSVLAALPCAMTGGWSHVVSLVESSEAFTDSKLCDLWNELSAATSAEAVGRFLTQHDV